MCLCQPETFVMLMAPNVEGMRMNVVYFILAKQSQFDQSSLVEKDFSSEATTIFK
jgi:hypothetical protein